MEVKRGTTIQRVSKELHSRGYVYLIEDRRCEVLVCGQRLPAMCEWLNAQLEDEIDRVALPSLYEASARKLRQGYHKLRWRCDKVPIDKAAEAIARAMRLPYDHVVVVGNRNCYQLLTKVDKT